MTSASCLYANDLHKDRPTHQRGLHYSLHHVSSVCLSDLDTTIRKYITIDWLNRSLTYWIQQEAQLSCDASCQLKSCRLPRNSAETTCTTSPEQTEIMKLEGQGGLVCSKHVLSTVTRSSRFHCFIGVINKPTTVELCISPVYRRLAVAKFSKTTM